MPQKGDDSSFPNIAFLNGISRNFLPKFITFLGFVSLYSALLRSSFFADDFTNVVKFNRNLGPVLETDGKLVLNLFWSMGTTFFGAGSALPFLITNISLFMLAIFILHHACRIRSWGNAGAFWILSFLFSLGVAYPILLWSSNIVHTAALFFFCLNFFIHQKYMTGQKETSLFATCKHAFILGLIWLMCTITNPLYIGFLILGAYFSLEQYKTVSLLKGLKTIKIWFLILSLNLLPAILGFALIAYPRVTSQAAYDISGPQFILSNLKFYFETLNSNSIFPYSVLILGLLIFLVVLFEATRFNLLPIALVLCSLGIVYPILIQGQQRAIHYFTVPVILIILSIFSSVNSVSVIKSRILIKYISTFSIFILMIILLIGGSSVRSWFVSTPFGFALEETREQISKERIDGQQVCIVLQMGVADRNRFIASMGGSNAFLIPPINAGGVEFDQGTSCANQSDRRIFITSDSLGNFEVNSP